MQLLKTVSPEQAEGRIKEIYSFFPAAMGVPEGFVMLSASPTLLEERFKSLNHYRTHAHLTPALLAAIRYVAAQKSCHGVCIRVNEGILTGMGLSAADLAELRDTGDSKALSDEERTMLGLVNKVLNDPDAVSAADVDAARGQGFTDADILEASAHGAGIIASSMLLHAFVKS